MSNRQDLIDAILELTRDPANQTYFTGFALLTMTTDQLGRVFDACADYDDVRHGAARRRSS